MKFKILGFNKLNGYYDLISVWNADNTINGCKNLIKELKKNDYLNNNKGWKYLIVRDDLNTI